MIQKFRADAIEYFRTKPLPLVYSLIGTGILSVLINKSMNGDRVLNSLIYAFMLGLSLCLGGDYLFEQKAEWKRRLPVLVGVVFAFGFALAYFFENLTGFQIHILAASYLLFLLMPPSVRKNEKVGFHWFIFVLYAVGLSLTISGILLGLVTFLVSVIKELFHIELLQSLREMGFAFFIVFLPINLFMVLRPRPEEVPSLRYHVTGFMEKSLRYLFVPVMLVYIAVLLAYSIKILVTFNLPQGMVSVPLGIAYLMFFAINAYFESQGKENEGVWKYHKWIQLSFIPLFVTIAVGIGTRIYQYGFTVDRVYLLIGFILMVVSMIVRLKYRALELRKLVGIAAIFLLVTSIGPLSPRVLSTKSQIRHFLKIATKYSSQYSKLADFKLSTWNQDDIESANSSLGIIEQNKAMEQLKETGMSRGVFVKGTAGAGLAFDPVDVRTQLASLDQGRHIYGKPNDPDQKVCKRFRTRDADMILPIRVTGYDWKILVGAGGGGVTLPESQDRFEWDLKTQTLKFVRNNASVDLIQFGDSVREYVLKSGTGLVDAPLVLNGENKFYRVQLRIRDVSIDCRDPYIEADLLVKSL